MKILAAPDLHCYWTSYDKLLPNGRSSRFQDFINAAEFLVDVASKEKIDFAVFPGDFFADSRPSPEQIITVLKLFSALEDKNIKVFGCSGNHDYVGVNQLSPVDIIAQFNNTWGITKNQIFKFEDLALFFLPFSHKFKEKELISVVEALGKEAETERFPILIGHYAIEGSIINNDGNNITKYRDMQTVLPQSLLKSLPFKIVIMGHIHVRQVLSTKPLILHPGTFQLRDFAEEDLTPPSITIIEIDENRKKINYKFIELPHRKFVTIKMKDLYDNNLSKRIENAIVRVKDDFTEQEFKTVNQDEIAKIVEDAGAYFFAGVVPNIITERKVRNAELSVDLDINDAFMKWLKSQTKIDPDIKEKVMVTFEEILKEFEESQKS